MARLRPLGWSAQQFTACSLFVSRLSTFTLETLRRKVWTVCLVFWAQ